LPLLPVQAEQLIATAERAPYGRGEETLTDPEVRRTWQISPDRVRLGGRHWSKTFDTIVARVAQGLGVTGKVEAQLYKLLIYDQGSFFVRHRDTEKVKGMFATLIVAVPSLSAGGELVVRHKEREARLDLRCEEPSDIAFAAFYADCVHEVLPVTAGYRWLWSIISCVPAAAYRPGRRIMPRRRMLSRNSCGNGLKPSDHPAVVSPKN
jgi:predicted 2-oxoglutarate/Fe(II)-dependent dioxygenase YbiX